MLQNYVPQIQSLGRFLLLNDMECPILVYPFMGYFRTNLAEVLDPDQTNPALYTLLHNDLSHPLNLESIQRALDHQVVGRQHNHVR